MVLLQGSPLGPILTNIFLSHHSKKTDIMNVLQNICQLFKEGMWMIFLYFINSINLSSRFEYIFFLNTRAKSSVFSMKNLAHFYFQTSCVTSNYRKPTIGEVFTSYESFIPTYQKREVYTYYFLEVLAYVVVSRQFIQKSII